MSIDSPTTTNVSPSNPLTTLLHSITKKRSISPVVQRFVQICVVKSDSTEHTEKLIRNLIKKLTKLKRTNSIDELEKAIVHNDSRTKCVTIPR